MGKRKSRKPAPGVATKESRSPISVTESELAAAFSEWDRRYREEPDRFMSEAEHLLRETPETYGDACAPYLLAILAEQRGGDSK